MNQRDGLRDLVYDAIEWAALEDVNLADHIAEAVRAAGYSRPRVVETIEGLDALPVHAVIRDRHGRIHERWDPAVEGDHGWVRSGWAFNDVAAIPLVPATVLYLPEEKP